jgi:hypothetical protein
MPRYAVRVNTAALVFELDAPDADSARSAIWENFREAQPYDPLQGTRFPLPHESGATDAQLMTASARGEDARSLSVEEL